MVVRIGLASAEEIADVRRPVAQRTSRWLTL